MNKNFQEIQKHLISSGFVMQNSEIYGGISNTWDYGHLGSMMIRNIKDAWYKDFILCEENNYFIDSKILMNPKVWKASGHLDNFSDPLIENKVNGKRYRADNLISEINPEINPEKMSNEELEKYICENIKEYENDKTEWSKIKNFNLMFETYQGVVEEKKIPIYLRPETAQGIFINFKNVLRTTRTKIPFGIGQIGKSFRNEVTPSNFIFRTREFEQMELEYFVKPNKDEEAYNEYVNKSFEFIQSLGVDKNNLKLKIHEKDELAHYSKGTTDIEYNFPFGWGELMGISNRTDFDLKKHQDHSQQSLEYLDPITNEKFIPYVIEPSVGVDRLMLAILCDAFVEEDNRIVLKINQSIAPYQFAILPLNKKIHSVVAKKVFKDLVRKGFKVVYDETGSIGKRYRRQDAIGTPYCITIIDDTEQNQNVTIRYRDTMEQNDINLSELGKVVYENK